MAPASRTVATSTLSGRRAQPLTARPPHSQDFVNAHPELCYAPRLTNIPLPSQAQPAWQHSPHIAHPTAYAPSHEGRDSRNALHMVPGPQAQTTIVQHPTHAYPSAHTPVNAVPMTPPPPYASTRLPIPVYVAPPTQTAPVPIPKSRYPTSPPTPEPSPPRPAVASHRRRRTSADDAQHGATPTT